MTNLNALLTEKAEAAGLSPDTISNIELLTERYIERTVEVNTPPRYTYTCAACGMTEDDHLNEWGMGPLIRVQIDIEPGEELQAFTGVPDHNGEYSEVKPARLCNEHFVEWLNAQPAWLQEHFAKVNPAHYAP